MTISSVDLLPGDPRFTSGALLMPATELPVFDPFAPQMAEDPYPTYAWLRAHEPVHHNRDRDIWAVAKYKDVQAVSRDWNSFTVTAGVDPDDRGQLLGINSLLEHDPPRHDLMRKVLRPFFTPAG